MPNAAGTSPIGCFKMTGPAPSGTRFVIDDTTNSPLSKFGGFLQIPCGNSLPTRDDTLRLFVDGKLAASKSVSYALSKR